MVVITLFDQSQEPVAHPYLLVLFLGGGAGGVVEDEPGVARDSEEAVAVQ